MYEKDWKDFLARGQGREIAVAQVSQSIADFLEAKGLHVYLRHDYALKSATKHGIPPAQFAAIFETIDYGEAYSDRPLHVNFFHVVDGILYQVTVKRAGESRRLYVATFYRQNRKEVARKTAKSSKLRP